MSATRMMTMVMMEVEQKKKDKRKKDRKNKERKKTTGTTIFFVLLLFSTRQKRFSLFLLTEKEITRPLLLSLVKIYYTFCFSW